MSQNKTDFPQEFPDVPLGLEVIAGRCAGEMAIHEATVKAMAPAYALALRLLSREDAWSSGFDSRAEVLLAEDSDTKDAAREITEAVKASGLYADAPEDAATGLMDVIRFACLGAGFRLGLAAAFEIQRSFTGGAKG